MFRIHGDLVPARGDALSPEAIESMLFPALTPDQHARLERDWHVCLSAVFPDCGRARVSVYRRNGRWEVAVRLTESAIRTREELGLPPIIDDLARKPSGLVILTGPTGVGKTTTFNYMIDLINAERACKIVTLEDPIEYVHPYKKALICQQEHLVDFHDFRSALRHVLRQDPDVIGVGELRDAETMLTALNAAETGHLVIATLHTHGASDAIQRMVSAFPAGHQDEVRYMLSGSLQGVISQQLLPRAIDTGRALCCEVLIGTGAVRHQIREGQLHLLYTEMQAGRKHGMITLDQALLDLYQRGEINYDTAISLARSPDLIRKRATTASA
jgi:twitching motility protein PilT